MSTSMAWLARKSLDPSEPRALYQQLKDVLLSAIREGEIEPSERFPSEPELENHFRVSRITVRRAIAELVSDGYLRRERGRGTFVLRSALVEDDSTRPVGELMHTLATQGRAVTSQVLRFEWCSPPRDILHKFSMPPETQILCFDRLVCLDGKPTYLAQHWINIPPESSTISVETLEEETIWDALRHCDGVQLTHGERTLQAVPANSFEARWLKVQIGAPLMLDELKLRNGRGQLVVFVKVLHIGESYKFHSLLKSTMHR